MWFKEVEKGGELTARVGLSFISSEKACKNAEAEIPDFSFQDTLAIAEKAWKEKLSVIGIDTRTPANSTGAVDMNDLQTIFWSGVYRAMISPQDYTGENPLWKSDEPYYDSYYCIWDSFRSIHPFITLVDPYSQSLSKLFLVSFSSCNSRLRRQNFPVRATSVSREHGELLNPAPVSSEKVTTDSSDL